MAPKSGMLNNYTALKIKALPRRRLYIYVTSITIKSNSGFSLFFLFFSLFNLRRRLGVFSCPSLFSCHVWSALWIGVDGCGSSCMLHTDCRREKDDSAVIHWDASNSTVLLLIWSEPLVMYSCMQMSQQQSLQVMDLWRCLLFLPEFNSLLDESGKVWGTKTYATNSNLWVKNIVVSSYKAAISRDLYKMPFVACAVMNQLWQYCMPRDNWPAVYVWCGSLFHFIS